MPVASPLRMLRGRLLPLSLGCMFLLGTAHPAPAQSAPTADNLTLNTDAVAPARFIAAHGHRALISGYASEGLEVWAYPFQILRNYRVAFHPEGATSPIDGQTILGRVTYTADSITRVYLGPDFIVSETLFVPLNEPAAILTYTIQSQHGQHGVDIEVHATPVLNLMWPAALGGQSTSWNSSLSAFVLEQQSSGYRAIVASPDITAHDAIANRTNQGTGGGDIGFTLHPADGLATVYIALNPPGESDPATLFHQLVQDRAALQAQYDQHVHDVAESMLSITTPDPRVNQAIAWSEIALDQAWVCNRDLGRGYVAGYGPSRPGRRPQYDWFFAGDGLIATDAALSAGNTTQARDELEFILRYQDKKSGMIWHELSQSAGFIDWIGKYPYMYVHVDITFLFLPVLARYVAATGDLPFARAHWPAIEAAYNYCESLIDPATGLPRIPLNKEGGNEQDRMSEDLGLSISWVEASSSFQQLASLTGHARQADLADHATLRARNAVPTRYWDPQHSLWITGFSESGHAITQQRSSPAQGIALHLYTPQQDQQLLDQLASAAFQTDWGSRGVASGSQGFDPSSYASGSVSADGTANLATTFWSAHRPVPAFNLWSSLLSWSSLDSLGHLHEVLAGNVYRPQEESVPEQTWSSAGFLTASVRGLLGLDIDALKNSITFAPHLPATWHTVSISNIPLSGAKISLTLHQTTTELILDLQNPGEPFHLIFAPDLALGASVDAAELNHRKLAITTEQHPQDTSARAVFQVMHGANEAHVALHGGISIITTNPPPLLGDSSHGLRVIDVHLAGDSLVLDADVQPHGVATLQLETPWQILNATGAIVEPLAPNLSQLTFVFPAASVVDNHYQHLHAIVQLKR